MTAVDMRCDICDSPDYIGVASVPAFPVSLAWCAHCLARGCMPIFCVEVTLCDVEVGPDGQEGGFMSLPATIEKHGVEKVMSVAADWFLDQYTWLYPSMFEDGRQEGPGYYVIIRDLIQKLGEDSQTHG